jgi:hypothetical protein
MALLSKVKSVILNDILHFDLLIKGQGVFIFNNNNNINDNCYFNLHNKDKTDGLKIKFTKNYVKVQKISTEEYFIDENNNKGLINSKGAYYWFSIDSQNQKLYAGIGEVRLETVIYKYNLTHDDKLFLESIVSIQILEKSKSLKQMKLLRDPFMSTIPLIIKNTNELTMNDIASGLYLPSANLSTIGQKLFNCISGKKFILDDVDFPDFSKAIEYSIKTEGLWFNKTLLKKSTEFNKDKPNILETYLRITIGENNGESPGIPYVMEIWPVRHYSPIHSHSSANAIIRVLHGKINVDLYAYLCDEKDGIKPFASKEFVKDEITWISPTLNQTHKLTNLEGNSDTCITIQCYMYDLEDILHYDYFDYININGHIEQYEPDSDMEFMKFKQLMKEEWNNRDH